MDSTEQIKQNFSRRFAFGVHALISIPVILLTLVFAYFSQHFYYVYNRPHFYGMSGPALIIPAVLFAMLGTHAIHVWNAESNQSPTVKRRRFLFVLHLMLTIAITAICLASVVNYGNFAAEPVMGSVPYFKGAMPPLVLFTPMLMLITLFGHGIHFAYRELLERTLHRKAKAKVENLHNNLALTDDGELFYDENEYSLKQVQ